MKKRLFEVEMWMWNPTVVTLRVEADGWESACDAAYTRLRDTREVFEEGAEYGERLDDLECWELTGARKIDADGVYKGTFEPYDRARGMFAVEFKRSTQPVRRRLQHDDGRVPPEPRGRKDGRGR